MTQQITCLAAINQDTEIGNMVKMFSGSGIVAKIILVGETEVSCDGFDVAFVRGNMASTKTIPEVAALVNTPFTLLITKSLPFVWGQNALHRMMQVCTCSGAGMVYADYLEEKEGITNPHPVNEYQEGSLRDDFDFGPMTLLRSEALITASKTMDQHYEYAGLYDLRLKISQKYKLVHIPEFLYKQL